LRSFRKISPAAVTEILLAPKKFVKKLIDLISKPDLIH
jgi:hypothetical protein